MKRTAAAIALTAMVLYLLTACLPTDRRVQPLADADCVWICVTPTATATATFSPTLTPMPSNTSTPTNTPFATSTPTVTPTPVTGWGRQGVAFTGPGDQTTFDATILAATWWYSYYAQNTTLQLSWIPMIRPSTTAAIIQWIAKRLAGRPILILNEPDYPASWGGDDIAPAAAATWYHDMREQVLLWDANARFIVGGMGNLGYYGWDWLRQMADSYLVQYGVAMPLDGVHVHHYFCGTGYVLQSWRDKVQAFRNWMTGYGWGGKELWLTEVGCLSNDAYAATVMNDQLTYLRYTAPIQRFAWFATRNDTGAGSLCQPVTTPCVKTNLGLRFVQ